MSSLLASGTHAVLTDALRCCLSCEAKSAADDINVLYETETALLQRDILIKPSVLASAQRILAQINQPTTVPVPGNSKKVSIEYFEPVAIIGKGAFGKVRLVKVKNEVKIDSLTTSSSNCGLYAMKSMHKKAMITKNQIGHIKAERDILSLSDNPWLVTLYYSFQDHSNLYMVMEYLPGGDLMGFLIKYETFDEKCAKFYMAELVLAISTVHALGYIHRDIKPDNILLDWNGHLKLIDLGLCKKVGIASSTESIEEINIHLTSALDNSQSESVSPKELMNQNSPVRAHKHRERILAYSTVGTPDYIAPEVLLQQGISSLTHLHSFAHTHTFLM